VFNLVARIELEPNFPDAKGSPKPDTDFICVSGELAFHGATHSFFNDAINIWLICIK
jgi:hypothetical protein